MKATRIANQTEAEAGDRGSLMILSVLFLQFLKGDLEKVSPSPKNEEPIKSKNYIYIYIYMKQQQGNVRKQDNKM